MCCLVDSLTVRLNSHEIVELLDCKTVRIFAYSSKREQSNKRSLTPRFTDFFTNFEKAKPTVLQSTELCFGHLLHLVLCIVHMKQCIIMSFQDLCHVTLPFAMFTCRCYNL